MKKFKKILFFLLANFLLASLFSPSVLALCKEWQGGICSVETPEAPLHCVDKTGQGWCCSQSRKECLGIDFGKIAEGVFPTGSFLRDPDLTITDIFSGLLPYIYILSGLALFIYLIMGGFELLTSGGNPENVKKAQGKITSAIVGFLIVFLSYWLIQLLEKILGITILG